RSASHVFLQIPAAAGAMGQSDRTQKTPLDPPRLLQPRDVRDPHSPAAELTEHPVVLHPVDHSPRVPAPRARRESQPSLPRRGAPVPVSPRVERVDSPEPVHPAGKAEERAGATDERGGETARAEATRANGAVLVVKLGSKSKAWGQVCTFNFGQQLATKRPAHHSEKYRPDPRLLTLTPRFHVP